MVKPGDHDIARQRGEVSPVEWMTLGVACLALVIAASNRAMLERQEASVRYRARAGARPWGDFEGRSSALQEMERRVAAQSAGLASARERLGVVRAELDALAEWQRKATVTGVIPR